MKRRMVTVATAHMETMVELGTGKVRLLKGGSGDPLVVLHQDIGNPGWLPFHDEMASRYTVYAPSCPGFDQSDRPDWARNVRDLAIIVQGLFQVLRLDRVPLVGLGFGGWMAAELATMAPGKFTGLVLVGPVGIQPKVGEIMDQFLIPTAEYVKAGFYDQSKFEELFGQEPDLDQLEVWELNREMTTRVAWKPYLFNQALPYLLPSVEAPTLLVYGKEDKQVPINCVERYQDGLPKARLEVFENCGHYVEIEKPDQLAKLAIDFLSSS